jgi:hypothetical protein
VLKVDRRDNIASS